MDSFLKGIVVGAFGMLALALVVLAFRFFQERDQELYEQMEARNEILLKQEAINNRSADEFLEEPGVRGAADTAADGFRRKRDEAVQRIRGGRAD
jgi:hypothetical protein